MNAVDCGTGVTLTREAHRAFCDAMELLNEILTGMECVIEEGKPQPPNMLVAVGFDGLTDRIRAVLGQPSREEPPREEPFRCAPPDQPGTWERMKWLRGEEIGKVQHDEAGVLWWIGSASARVEDLNHDGWQYRRVKELTKA